MNSKIKLINDEFENGNYEKCLRMVDELDEDFKKESGVLIFKMYSLSLLKRYDECLEVIDVLMKNRPDRKLLWIEKIRCHYLMGDDEKVKWAVESLENIVGTDDKEILVMIGDLFNLMDEPQKALKYFDDALKIDPSYREALFKKSTSATMMKDDDMMYDISERLRECSKGNLISLVPVFVLKLMSKDFRGALDMIEEDFEGKTDGVTVEMLKGSVYNNLIENLDVQLIFTDKVDLSVSQVLDLLLMYYEKGIDNGEIEGVMYLII